MRYLRKFKENVDLHNSNINMFLQFLSYKCQNKNINLTKIDIR